jgi:hypothetical protein
MAESPVLNHTNSAATQDFPSPVRYSIYSAAVEFTCFKSSSFTNLLHFILLYESDVSKEMQNEQKLFPKKDQIKVKLTFFLSSASVIEASSMSTGVPLCVMYLTLQKRAYISIVKPTRCTFYSVH